MHVGMFHPKPPPLLLVLILSLSNPLQPLLATFILLERDEVEGDHRRRYRRRGEGADKVRFDQSTESPSTPPAPIPRSVSPKSRSTSSTLYPCFSSL